MASGKSPGLDGFPAEFFQQFWPLMGVDYVEVLNYCYKVGNLLQPGTLSCINVATV